MSDNKNKKKRFPKDFIDPKNKDASWHYEIAEAIFYDWDRMNTDSFCKGVNRYRRNSLYSLGKQDISKLKKAFEIIDDPGTSYSQIDYTPIPIIPKFRRIVNEMHGKMKFGISVDAVDPMSMSDKRKYQNDERANIKMREKAAEMGMKTQLFDSGEVDQPMDEGELAIKMEFGYKHNSAIKLEKMIKKVFTKNRINDALFPQIRRDIFDIGVGGTKDYIDSANGSTKIRRVRGENFGVSSCVNEDFSDATHFFEIVFYTPGELKKALPHLSDTEFTNLIESNSKFVAQTGWLGDSEPYNQSISDSYRIPVLDFEYKSTDRAVYQVQEGEFGFPHVTRASWQHQYKKKYKDHIELSDTTQWYKGKWVIGAGPEAVFEYGKVELQKRKSDNKHDAVSSFTMFAPELKDMETFSIVDSLIPIVDRIMMAWYKLQNVIDKARPKGILIELTSLESVDLGSGGPQTPMGILDFYEQTGNLIYRRENMGGDYANGRPIDELNNGIGQEAQEWFNIIREYFNMIRELVGFNDVTDASTPHEKTLKSVAEMAQISTSNAINHLKRAETSIYERLAESVCIRTQDAILLGFDDGHEEDFGSDMIKSIEEETDYLNRVFTFMFVEEPTIEEKQQLAIDTTDAMNKDQLTYDQKAKIQNIDNIKQAEQVLAYMVRKTIQRVHQEKLDVMKQQEQSNVAAAKAQSEGKIAEVQAEWDKRIEHARVEGEEDRKTIDHTYKSKSMYGDISRDDQAKPPPKKRSAKAPSNAGSKSKS
jgi:hypothetical protein